MDPKPPSERNPLLPAHIAWPLLVVALLLMSVGFAVRTLIAARSDGGVQLVEDPSVLDRPGASTKPPGSR